MLFDVFEQHLIYCIGDFVEISYAIKKEPLLRDSHQMPMVGLEPSSLYLPGVIPVTSLNCWMK